MKKVIVLTALIFIGVAGWRIGNRLSPDALGMAIGVLFGVLAGVPMALLAMAAGRRRNDEAELGRAAPRGGLPAPYGGYPSQAPIIVLAGGQPMQPGYGQPGAYPGAYGAPAGYPPHTGYAALPGPQTIEGRQFKVVGEKEEWVDEW